MGSKSQESTSSTQPNPVVSAALERIMARGFNVADQPLQQYQGPMVAGFTPDQQAAFQNINNAQGMALPFLNQAAKYAQPQRWNQKQFDRYGSPYQQNVIDSTMANINQTNQMQSNDLRGNAISAGAFGGDRAGVAQAALAGQQNMTNNSTLAGLQNQNYAQALGQFNTVQQQRAQAGNQLANYGLQGQSAALQAANAQLGIGGMQQQLAQQQMNIPYQQFQQQQQHPYYTTNFLSGLLSGIGGLGGSTTTQTTPGPNMFSQIGGLAMAALPMAFGMPPIPISTGGAVGGYSDGVSMGQGEREAGVPDISDAFLPLQEFAPAALPPPPPLPEPEEEQNMLGMGLTSMLQSFAKQGSFGSMNPAKTKFAFGKGGRAPQFNLSNFSGTPTTVRTAENQPAGTYGMGDWYNPLPQIPLSDMPPPLITPLPGNVVNPAPFLGGVGGPGGWGGGRWGGGMLGFPVNRFAGGGGILPGYSPTEDEWMDAMAQQPPLDLSGGEAPADEGAGNPYALPTAGMVQNPASPAQSPAFLELKQYAGPHIQRPGSLPPQEAAHAPAAGQNDPSTIGKASTASWPAAGTGASSTREGLFGTSVGAEGDTWRLPVMRAGLAIAAGDSPFALSNVGDGLAAGLQSWESQRAATAAAEAERAKAMQPRYEKGEDGFYRVDPSTNTVTLVTAFAPKPVLVGKDQDLVRGSEVIHQGARSPEPRHVVDGALVTGEGKELYRSPTAGAAAAKPTADNFKMAGYADQMANANEILNRLAGKQGTDLVANLTSRAGILGDLTTQPDYKSYAAARDQFINAVARPQSGAVISDSEYARYNKMFFPQPGDPPSVVAEKAQMRQIELEHLKRAAGPVPLRSAGNGNMPRPKSQAERDALPSGTRYITPDGQEGVRP